jgi:hypothetical protein
MDGSAAFRGTPKLMIHYSKAAVILPTLYATLQRNDWIKIIVAKLLVSIG